MLSMVRWTSNLRTVRHLTNEHFRSWSFGGYQTSSSELHRVIEELFKFPVALADWSIAEHGGINTISRGLLSSPEVLKASQSVKERIIREAEQKWQRSVVEEHKNPDGSNELCQQSGELLRGKVSLMPIQRMWLGSNAVLDDRGYLQSHVAMVVELAGHRRTSHPTANCVLCSSDSILRFSCSKLTHSWPLKACFRYSKAKDCFIALLCG